MKEKTIRYFIPTPRTHGACYKEEDGFLYYYNVIDKDWYLSRYTSICYENYKEVEPEEFVLYAGFL